MERKKIFYYAISKWVKKNNLMNTGEILIFFVNIEVMEFLVLIFYNVYVYNQSEMPLFCN